MHSKGVYFLDSESCHNKVRDDAPFVCVSGAGRVGSFWVHIRNASTFRSGAIGYTASIQ